MGKADASYDSVKGKQYDAAAKQLFSRSDILTPMIAGTVREVEGYSLEEIRDMLSLDEDGITVRFLDGEDRNFIGEAKNIFDRLTEIRLPDGETIPFRIVFDLEPQGKEYRDYPIENRAQYYAARLLSPGIA